MALIVAGGMVDDVEGSMDAARVDGMADSMEGSMDDSGVGGMTVVVFRDIDGSVDRGWTATAVSFLSGWLSPELMLPGPLSLTMRQCSLLVLKYMPEHEFLGWKLLWLPLLWLMLYMVVMALLLLPVVIGAAMQ